MMPSGSGVFFAHPYDEGEVAFIGLSETFSGSPSDYSILSHECLHCTFYMLRERGLPYSQKTEEAYTYFHSFLLATLAENMLAVEARLKKQKEKRAKAKQ